MKSELSRGALEQDTGGLNRQRWQRVGLRSGRIERSAGEAGDPEFLFDLGVVRLEVGITDRPVLKVGAGHGTPACTLAKVEFFESPEVAGKVNGSSAHHAPV